MDENNLYCEAIQGHIVRYSRDKQTEKFCFELVEGFSSSHILLFEEDLIPGAEYFGARELCKDYLRIKQNKALSKMLEEEKEWNDKRPRKKRRT